MRHSNQTDTKLLPNALNLISRLIVPVTLIVFALPFVALLYYSVPALDDFCKATLSFNAVPQPGVLSITWMYYTQWSPRWLTTLLQSSVMSHVDLARAYGWLLLVVMITNCAALWYFFRTVFHLTRANSLLVAGVFYAAYVASLADPAQELYWLTGAIEYNLSFSTLLVLVSLLYQRRKGVWYYLAIVLLSIAIPAQHEIAGAFLFALLVIGIVITRVQKLPTSQWYASLIAATISQIIVMLSPGNARRAVQEHRHLWDLAHLPHWIDHAFYHGAGWFSHPAILVGAFCIFLLYQRDQDPQYAGTQLPDWLGFAGISVMFAVCCEVAFVEIASGIWVPYRTVAWFQFVFWLGFVCTVMVGIPALHKMRFSSVTRIGVFALLALTLFGSANFRWAVSDLRGPAKIWWQMSNSRLRESGGALEFEPPTRYPHMAMHQDLAADSGCWVNRCLANYVHAKSVAVKNSAEECP